MGVFMATLTALAAIQCLLFVLSSIPVADADRRGLSPQPFDSSGSIRSLENTRRAIRSLPPCIGIRCRDGVILVAVTQKASKLQVHEPQKIYQVDSHLCVAVTGRQALAADVIKEMRGRCLQHKADYDTLIPVEKLCDATAARFHSFTCNPEQSPLGLSMIVAGRDDLLGTQVYTIDVDGGMAAWKGAVIGKHSDVLSDRLAAMSDLIEGMLDVKDVLPRLERLIREATSSRTDFADDRVNNKLDDGNDEDGDKKCLQIFCGTHTASGAFTWSSVSA